MFSVCQSPREEGGGGGACSRGDGGDREGGDREVSAAMDERLKPLSRKDSPGLHQHVFTHRRDPRRGKRLVLNRI